MHKIINYVLAGLLTVGLTASPMIVRAHELTNADGYSAVFHMDPDDEPAANELTTLNFLVRKDTGSYIQTDYRNTLAISSNGKLLKTLPLKERSFGNAGDGIASYTFPKIGNYKIALDGQNLTDTSKRFHIVFDVTITENAVATSTIAATNKGGAVLLLGATSLVLLAAGAAFMVKKGGRYGKGRAA